MLLFGSLSLVAHAGPLSVGWQDITVEDELAGSIPARVYYPATASGRGTAPDTSSGPWPLAGFLHGWLGSAWMYDEICAELASWGFVVASLDTQNGLVLDMEDFAHEAALMLRGVEARSATPGDSLEGLVSDDDWVALGHSMGGGTLARLLELEPQIRTAVAFMPYQGYPSYYEALGSWEGSLLVLSGTHDTTAPPAMQRAWLQSANATSRSLLVEVTDMGHQAVTDLSFGEDPMPDAEQREIVISLATAFVRAEHLGDEALWATLIGPGVEDLEVTLASRSHDPALWATLEGQRLSLGVAGLSPSEGELFIGTAPGDDGLVDPVSVAALDLPLGVAGLTLDLPDDREGDLWAAVRLEGEGGPVWTRAIPLRLGEQGADPEDPSQPQAPSDEAQPGTSPEGEPRDSCGCSTSPGPTLAWTWPLAIAAWRRRWAQARATQPRRSWTSPSATSCSAATTPSATCTSPRSSA